MKDSFVGVRQGAAPFPISILDFAMAGRGYTAREALAATINLARLVDRRGFTRYWVAEHHAMPGVTTSSSALLLARLVGETKRIRLGAGGMMLPNFPPLVIAEQFGLLTSLAPGRIDLGIGRAPGAGVTTAIALRRGHIGTEDFPECKRVHQEYNALQKMAGASVSECERFLPECEVTAENAAQAFVQQPERLLSGEERVSSPRSPWTD